ncbi:hypothetical protein VJ918_11295 [Adlercreutzia sp. R21]|nr:hypothetical protein [Adlercreutzia sp. R21]
MQSIYLGKLFNINIISQNDVENDVDVDVEGARRVLTGTLCDGPGAAPQGWRPVPCA